jgi:hypothetical protein
LRHWAQDIVLDVYFLHTGYWVEGCIFIHPDLNTPYSEGRQQMHMIWRLRLKDSLGWCKCVDQLTLRAVRVDDLETIMGLKNR